MKSLLSLLFVVFIHSGLACKPQVPGYINIAVDLEKEIQQFYDKKILLSERPSLSVNNCRETALSNKYIMIGLGLENLVLTNEVTGFSFTPEEESIECRLENNPFKKVETATDRYKKNLRNREFFDRCVTIQVTELNENVGLSYPQEQPGCKIEKISKWSVNFSGPYCFFKPHQESNISIHIDVRKECRSVEGLSSQETILSDYTGLLNIYLAGDATGFSPDLSALTSTDIRLSVNPLSEILPVSDDFGQNRPRWPLRWRGSDIFMGEVKVASPSAQYDEIMVEIATNMKCDRKCSGKICTSECDYAQPIVGEYTLYEIVKGKREFLKLWHDGSVSPPQYQGVLNGMGVTIPKGVLEAGKKYALEARYREPDLDFAYFSGRIDRALRFERNYIGPLSREGQINHVPLINTIAKPGVIPDVPIIRSLSFENSHLTGLSRALATWQSKLNNSFWPPIFTEMCSDEGSCVKAGMGYVTLLSEFTLKPKEKGFEVNLIKSSRESNVVSSASWGSESIPTVSCGDQDNDDNDDFDWGDIL